jgi:DNA-binding transcriptional MerR regulator
MKSHVITPQDLDSPLLSVSDLSAELGVSEQTVRAWLSDFNWERRFDGQGQLCFSTQDADLLALIKSLELIEDSCTAIETRLGHEAPEPPQEDEWETPPAEDELNHDDEASDLAQVESLKAELRELHGNRPEAAPRWQFWKRW